MSKLKTTTIVSVAAGFLLFSASANASDLGEGKSDSLFNHNTASSDSINWSGPYIGGTIGYGNSNHNLKADGTMTETTPASCTEGDLVGGQCIRTTEVPAVEESCSEGAPVDGKCVEVVERKIDLPPATHTKGKEPRCEGGASVKLNADKTSCVLANDTDIEVPDAYVPGTEASCSSGQLSANKKYCVLIEQKVTDTVIPDAEYTPAKDATTKTEVLPDAFVAGIDVEHTAHAFIDGLNSSGIFGGGTIGADVQRGHFLFGLYGDYNFSNAKFETGLSFDNVSLGSASIEDGDSWLVAARAGYLFGKEKRALLYVLGGYGQQDVRYSIDGIGSKDVTFSGFIVGAGGEYALTRNVFIGIEYQHFFGGEETLYDGQALGFDNLKVTDEVDSDKIMAKLKIKLNGNFGN